MADPKTSSSDDQIEQAPYNATQDPKMMPWEELVGLPKRPFPQFTFRSEIFVVRFTPMSTNILC